MAEKPTEGSNGGKRVVIVDDFSELDHSREGEATGVSSGVVESLEKAIISIKKRTISNPLEKPLTHSQEDLDSKPKP